VLAVSCGLLAGVVMTCARRVVSPSERPARIFVTDARLDRMPLYAAAVKAQQSVSPTIWLAIGDAFADRRLKNLTDGDAQVSLLNRAGIDAIVLTPAWLGFGLPRLAEIVSKGRYYALSANLVDASGQTIGYPFMVRRSGTAVVAITGIVLDSANVLTHLAGIKYAAPGLAAGKAIALMRQRADLVGVMVEPRSTGPAWGADFAVDLNSSAGYAMTPSVDSSRINCYDVSADANRLTATTVDLVQLGPDTSVARLLDSFRAAAGSLAARPLPAARTPRTRARLTDELVRGLLAAKLADGFLCDSLFVADSSEPTSVGDLIDILRDPGRLALLPVSRVDLGRLPPELVLRPGLSRAKLSQGQTYRVATTVDYLQRHPDLAEPGFDLSARPLWTICLQILESGSVR